MRNHNGMPGFGGYMSSIGCAGVAEVNESAACEAKPMDLDQFQADAVEMIAYDQSIAVDGIAIYPALALNEEAGEVAGKVAKAIRKDAPVDLEALKQECGDVLWNLAALCHEAGFSLSSVAHANLAKLRSRQSRGVIKGDGDNR